MLAADRADHLLVLGDELIHLVKAHGVDVDVGELVRDQLVGAVAGLAGAAVQQRVGEAGHMAGGDPGLGVHQDGRVEADVIGALLHKLFQPCLLDVVLELDAEGAVVPAVGQAAVDLGAGENEAPVLAQGHDHIKCLFAVFHVTYILSVRGWFAVSCVSARRPRAQYPSTLPCCEENGKSYSTHSPFSNSATSRPSRVRPVMRVSAAPIMTSSWMRDWFMPRASSSSSVREVPPRVVPG